MAVSIQPDSVLGDNKLRNRISPLIGCFHHVVISELWVRFQIILHEFEKETSRYSWSMQILEHDFLIIIIYESAPCLLLFIQNQLEFNSKYDAI